MTREEAEKLTTFKNYCICGGYACSMNGRNPADPHESWCPQKEEYDAWYLAMNPKGSLNEH